MCAQCARGVCAAAYAQRVRIVCDSRRVHMSEAVNALPMQDVGAVGNVHGVRMMCPRFVCSVQCSVFETGYLRAGFTGYMEARGVQNMRDTLGLHRWRCWLRATAASRVHVCRPQ